MTSRIIPVEPFDFLIFGGTGDLARRKLIPALFHRFCAGQIKGDFRLIGLSRNEMSSDAYRELARSSIVECSSKDCSGTENLEEFLTHIECRTISLDDPASFESLKEVLTIGNGRPTIYYLAIPPALFGPVCIRLREADLNHSNSRVVLEKPIGYDRASAKAINSQVGDVFDEDRIYRIDHYLGKETVQNLMALRFANHLFEPVWRGAFIDNVQITVAETLGIEGRSAYYDSAGAVRDMVQNHMMQLLCLVALEPPDTMNARSMREEKIKVLCSLNPIEADRVAEHTVRGQYRDGIVKGVPVCGYLAEPGIEAASQTETFVAIRAYIENWRWAGVPFYLRTGKRLTKRVSEIVVTFRSIPHSIFGELGKGLMPNRLVIRLQPDEGIHLYVMIKDPGPGGFRLRSIPLDMTFADSFEGRFPDAYERLLLDVVRGDQTLFMHRREVDRAWNWIEPVINAWENSGEAPHPYSAGSWGPSSSIRLLARDHRAWFEDELI